MNNQLHGVTFEAIDLAERLAHLNDEEIDSLPFGVLLVSAEGKVLKYSKREAELSGYGSQSSPVGLDFFTQLAPCIDVATLRARLTQAQQSGHVDIEFGHIGDYSDRSRSVQVRILSGPQGAYWHVHKRVA